MIDLGPHAVFIISAYLGVALVLILMIFLVWLGSNKQRTRLKELEAKGIRRRSENANNKNMELT